MKKLVSEILLKEWMYMFVLCVLSAFFCVLIFFSDCLFGWNERIIICVPFENLLDFQKIDQPFFDFQVLNSPNGTVQLLKEDSKWTLKNGNELSDHLKKELMNLCMEIKESRFEESGLSLKNHLLILYSCLCLFFDGCILMIKSDVQCFHLKKNLIIRFEFYVLLCRLLFFNAVASGMIGLCIAVRNSYDLGKGWLLCMKRYGLIEKLYNSFESFFYDHAANIVVQMILIIFVCILLSILIRKICQFTINKKAYALIFVGLISILYLMYDFMIFQSRFPDLIEFMPFVGLIFVLRDICEGIYVLRSVFFAMFIHVVLIMAL